MSLGALDRDFDGLAGVQLVRRRAIRPERSRASRPHR
jgi:hypothetical protein